MLVANYQIISHVWPTICININIHYFSFSFNFPCISLVTASSNRHMILNLSGEIYPVGSASTISWSCLFCVTMKVMWLAWNKGSAFLLSSSFLLFCFYCHEHDSSLPFIWMSKLNRRNCSWMKHVEKLWEDLGVKVWNHRKG